MAIERSTDDHRGTQRWKIIEDLRPHLDSLVEELGRMPTNSELRLRKCGALASAISQFRVTISLMPLANPLSVLSGIDQVCSG